MTSSSSYSSFFPATPSLKVLILGAGGREHAIAHHLLKDTTSSTLTSIHVCPGNGGTATIDSKRCFNLDDPQINPKPASGNGDGDFTQIVNWSIQNGINLCIPGPEQPLVDGVEAAFRRVGIPVFGPSPLASQMEGSKTFSKAFMDKHSIPTADFHSFNSDQVDQALQFIQKLGGAKKVVLKASGLAGGKGVLLPENEEEAKQGVEDILVKKVFGSAGSSLLIEERLVGPELSVLVFSDGYTSISLPGCQDHKRIHEGDLGPNTGGMGAYTPSPSGLIDNLPSRIQSQVVEPSISGMRADGFPFVGILFIGLMLTEEGPKVLEYNVRFGDPETEAVLNLMDTNKEGGGSNLAEVFKACTERRLDSVNIKIKEGSHSVSVVLASKGYPGKYEVGKEIQIKTSELPSNVNVYHAGTKLNKEGKLVTAGGRVLIVTGTSNSLKDALDLAYQGVSKVSFEGMTFRKDIGFKALEFYNNKSESKGMTYASAGVSVDNGNSLVEAIKPLAKSTKRLGCDSSLGGFGGTFDLKPLGFKDPVLISGTDGVGTKLRVALDCGSHDTVGIDLVAMSVNDLLVQGALPLYFLDYFACSTLSLPVAVSVISGIAHGCRLSNCGLIGGETAEMPGMYSGEEYDLAGFAVGAVERSELLPRLKEMSKGDILVGIKSSGVHSNGFSLVRKIVEKSGLKFQDQIPWDIKADGKECLTYKEDGSEGQLPSNLGQALLTPTRLYVSSLTPLFEMGNEKSGITALCHITGGGFTDNLPRILPSHLACKLDVSGWKRPGVFNWLQKTGSVENLEMARTFNCGIGMVICVKKGKEDNVIEVLRSVGEDPVRMGEIVDRKGEEVLYEGLESWN